MKLIGKPYTKALQQIAEQAIAIAFLLQLLQLSLFHSSACGQQSHSPSQEKIDQWIEQLSDNDFGARESAFRRLERVGLLAFDSLHTAAQSEIPSVRLAAVRLLELSEHDWISDIQCGEIRPLLLEYTNNDTNVRKACIHKIADFKSEDSIVTLMSICRYESETLSRIAAIKILRLLSAKAFPIGSQGQLKIPNLAQQQQLHLSSRIAASWVIAGIAANRVSPVWKELCHRELDYLENHLNLNPSDHQSRLDLVQWHLDECFHSKSPVEFESLENRFLIQVLESQSIGTLIWLEQNNRFAAVDQLAIRHREYIDKSPVALHVIAKSKFNSGNFDDVDELLRKSDRATGKHASNFLQLGVTLKHLGFDQLSERALGRAIDCAETGSGEYFQASLVLAQNLQQQLDFQSAYLQLNDIHNRVKDNETTRKTLKRHCGMTPRQIHARTKYALAMHHRMQGEAEACLQLLLEATELDSDNSDILIALHRFANDDDEAFGDQVVIWVNSRIDKLESEQEKLHYQLQNAEGAKKIASIEISLAMLLNRSAWLRANTGIGLPIAEKAATLACQLRPHEPAYLDTLARCQFRTGKAQLAIQTQKIATLHSPGNARYQQQLESYQKSLRRSVLANLKFPLHR